MWQIVSVCVSQLADLANFVSAANFLAAAGLGTLSLPTFGQIREATIETRKQQQMSAHLGDNTQGNKNNILNIKQLSLNKNNI